jgi:hypothetical protein
MKLARKKKEYLSNIKGVDNDGGEDGGAGGGESAFSNP